MALYATVLAVIVLALLTVSLTRLGKVHTRADYLVAGRSLPAFALIYFIAPRARRFAQFTIPDLLEARYNQAARVLGVVAILFTYTAITSYQIIGGGDILHLSLIHI